MNTLIARNIKPEPIKGQYDIFLHFFEYALIRLEEKLKTKTQYVNYQLKNNKIEEDGLHSNCKYISINNNKVIIDFSDLSLRILGISNDLKDYVKDDSIKAIVKTIVFEDSHFNHNKHYSFYDGKIYDFWFYPYNYFYKTVINDIQKYKNSKGYDLFGLFGPANGRKEIVDIINECGIDNSFIKCLDHRSPKEEHFLSIDKYYETSLSSKINLVIPGQGIASYQRFYDTSFSGGVCMMMNPLIKMTIKPEPFIHYYPIDNIIRRGSKQQKVKECEQIVKNYLTLIDSPLKMKEISSNAMNFVNDHLTYEKMFNRFYSIIQKECL